MKHILIIAFSLLISSNICGQNIILNGDFEQAKRGFVTYIGKRPIYNDTFYSIDSFTYHWEALWGLPHIYNSSLPYKNGLNGVGYMESHPRAFKNNAAAYIYPNYKTKDTLDLSPIFNADTSGRYKGFNRFNGWYLLESSGFFQQLNTPLKKDTNYIVSYRLKSGNNVFPNDLKDNNMSIFGIMFSSNNLQDSYSGPEYRRQYKIDNYRTEFQDTILDTSNRWRLIKVAFKSDSAYKYLNFAQFMDRKKYAKYKIRSLNTLNGFLKNFELTFPFYVDDVRLLPRWQYLDVSPDVNACEGDSISLNVLSGSGPYKWILSSQPNIILSNANSLKIKADTTSMFQVMSPYDTASIMVYVSKAIYDSISITSCGKYLWRGKWRSTAGIYKDTAISAGSCKSFYTLNFKRTLNNKVTRLDSTELLADQDSVSYQWYSCNPWTKIDGETKRNIKVSKTKTYAVILNNGKGCIDTSDCISMSGSNIVSEEKLDWRVFPNPFQDAFNIELDKNYTIVRVKLYDVYGKLIINETVKNISRYTLHNSKLSFGTYYLQVEAENSSRFFNLKKE